MKPCEAWRALPLFTLVGGEGSAPLPSTLTLLRCGGEETGRQGSPDPAFGFRDRLCCHENKERNERACHD